MALRLTFRFSVLFFFWVFNQSSPVYGSFLSNSIEPGLSLFYESPRAQQNLFQLRSNSAQAQGVLHDSPLTVGLSVSRLQGAQLSDAHLLQAGGANIFQNNSIETSVAILPKNIGAFNSLALELSYSFNSFQSQIAPGLGILPRNNFSPWEVKLSYDIVKGGASDPVQLANEVQKYTFSSAYYNNAINLVTDYLTYHDALLDLMAAWCKLQNAEEDLKNVSNTLSEIQLSYSVKSISYKQVLNVIDTKNSIMRNRISYELQFEAAKLGLKVWNDKKYDEIAQGVVKSTLCRLTQENIDGLLSEYQTKDHSAFVFEKSMQFQASKFDSEARQARLAADRVVIKPSVRPFIGVKQASPASFQYPQYEAGIAINWNMPGEKQNTTVAADLFEYQSSRAGIEAARNQFASVDAGAPNDLERNKELLKVSWESYSNSNALIKLLEVQKSIGQIDSLSISNAYLQRNQILSSLYDSLARIEKDYARWRLLIDWKDVLVKGGINLK